MRKHLGAAALGCGIFLLSPAFADTAPAAGALPERTLQRLLLVDAERFGNRIVAVGDRGYVVISDDFGKSWRRAKAPAAPLLTAIDFLDDQLGIAVGHDSVILVTSDRGESWTQAFSAASEQRPLLDVLFVKKDFAVAVGAYGAYYESTDSGKTWAARKITSDDKHFNAVLELGEGRMLILGEAGTILTSGDWGKTWTPVTSPYKGSLFGGVVAEDGAVLAFGMRGRIFRSNDRGHTWTAIDNASTATLIGGDKLFDGSIVLAGSAGTALVSRDNGQSFVPVKSGTTRALSKPVQGAAGVVLLLGEGGPRDVSIPSTRPASQ
ncbi:MAG TPA: YCF48-related protein [Usitatibacter sp.]|nr:YCF48-related protein [Usitatibacter sp.]